MSRIGNVAVALRLAGARSRLGLIGLPAFPGLPALPRRLARLALLVTLAAGAALPLARAQSSPIALVAPPDGGTGVWNGHRVIVDFARDMDQASAEASFAITPTLRGHFEWPRNDRRRMEFVPHDIYRGSQTVAVSLAAARLRDAAGQPALAQSHRWQFTAQEPTAVPRFSSGLPVQQLTLAGRQGIPFQPGYPRARFALRLYALSGPQFAARYAALTRSEALDLTALDPAGLSMLDARTVDVDASSTPARLPLPEGLAAGLYLVEALHPALPPARELLVVSDIALAARAGRQGLLVWAARQPEGSLAPDARFTVYDAQGRRLLALNGDAQGLARLPERGEAGLLVALADGQPAVLGLDPAWASSAAAGGGLGLGSLSRDVVAHIHTDRPIYRPGHTVHWKAVLQQVVDEGLAPLAATEPVTVTLRDPASNLVRELALRPDAFGSVSGDLALGDGAALGTWLVDVRTRGQWMVGRFEVQDYVKPEFAVELEADRPYHIDGQTAVVRVQAEYFFGQPVAAGELVLRLYDRARSSQPIQVVEGVLDATGSFEAALSLGLKADASGQRLAARFGVEAEVTDASRRPVYGSLDLPVHPADLALGLALGGYSQPVGRPVPVTATLRDHEGRPVAGRAVELSAYRYERGRETAVLSVSGESDAAGRAVLTLKGLDLGSYRLRATARDDQARVAAAQDHLWVYSLSRPWRWTGGLAIEADRPGYRPGDTARLIVKSPYTTTALLVLEGPEVHAERVLALAGATTVELPISAAMAPGVTARILLWEAVTRSPGAGYDHAAEGQLVGASLAIPVSVEERRLRVEVLPDRPHARPGESLGLRLRVRDAEGRPVRAQLSLAMVDAALLALVPDPSGDIFDRLWAFRPSAVSGVDSWGPSGWYWSRQTDLSQRYWSRPTAAPGTAAPGGSATPAPLPTSGASPAPSPTLNSAGGGDGPADEPAVQPRRDLPDTAYWNAAILTDAQGEATLALTLPDSLTTWQLLARAVDREGRAGQGTGEVVVSKPISVDAALPRFLVQGDRVALDLLARNDADAQPLPAYCRLDSPGLIQLDPGERRLTLEQGAMTPARWSAVAADVGSHRLTATLRTPLGDDALEQELRIEPFTVPEVLARSGVAAARPVTETFDLPATLHPGRSLVEVTLSPSLASSVLGGLDALIGFPYGCVEQTMSRMLPNGVVGRLLQEMDLLAPELRAKLPPMMDLGLQKLYGYQAADGSWGWWSGGGNAYLTAYVLHGLTLAQASGTVVDAAVLDRGFAALDRLLAGERDATVQAYALFVLAEAGRADADALLALHAQRASLDSFGLGALALALEGGDRGDLAAEVLDQLLARAVRDERGLHWAVSAGGLSYGNRSMASEVKSTAMGLLAIARLRPEDGAAPEVLRWLMGRRDGQFWGQSTHDSAWAVLALTDWIVVSGELTASYDWRLTWDGREIAGGRHIAERESVAPPILLRLPADALAPGRHSLRIEKEAAGRLYYSIAGRLQVFYGDFRPVAAAGSGLSLRREYMAIDGRTGAERWEPGDLVNVRLTLQAAQDLSYVMVQDWLPAGFEPVNTGLGTETKRLPNGQLPWWRWGGYERRELRDEGATFFATQVRAGRSTFEYAVRAVTPGRFGARPAEAYAMYRPEIWARSDSRRVDIALNQVAEAPPLPGDIDGDCRLSAFDADLVAAAVWQADAARDLDASGMVDALDIALADARRGLSCGAQPPAPPPAAGELALELSAEAADDGALTFSLRTAAPALGLTAWELTLDLPAGGLRLMPSDPVRPTAQARLLGPALDQGGRRLRLGGHLPGGADLPAGSLLARVRLSAPGPGMPSTTGLIDARAAAADGRRLAVTVGGDGLRAGWSAGRLSLPWVLRP